MKKILPIFCIIVIITSGLGTSAFQLRNNINEKPLLLLEDLDPLVDISISVDIQAIRALDEIDSDSNPDFYIKLFINGEEHISPIWDDQIYLYDCWTFSQDVDDTIEFVDISVELWDKDTIEDKICDISGDLNTEQAGFDINIIYSVKTGLWESDDYLGDPSGYGRLSGCDDGSIYSDENDCEIWFDIYQTDFDNDGLPYHIENFIYQTDPEIDNTGEDMDQDGIPIEWEHHWGYDPFVWDEHEELDLDYDSINNTEEYLTWDFKSDPFRKDIFFEMDFMEDINGEQIEIPDETFELLQNPYNRRNIVFHSDFGQVEGGELIPFDDNTDFDELLEIHNDFFLHNDLSNWRRGVFHYGIVVYYRRPSMAFSGDTGPYFGYYGGTNSFVISKSNPDYYYEFYNQEKSMAYLYAANFMHEMGHNFGIKSGHPNGCDHFLSSEPWMFGYWLYQNYKSIMNYRYIFDIFDYSDGTNGVRDFDDWGNIDLTYFERSSKSGLNTLNI